MQCSPVKKSMYRYDLSGVRRFFLFPPLCHCFIHTRICGDFSSFHFFHFFILCFYFPLPKTFFFFFKGKCLTLLYNIMLKKGKKEELFWVYTGYSYHPFWVVRVVETLLVLTCSEDVTYLIDTIVQCTASRTSLGGWCEATVTKLLRAFALAEVLNVVSICV